MNPRVRNTLLAGCAILVATTVARAQPVDPIGDLLSRTTQRAAPAGPLTPEDKSALAQALTAARRGDVFGARAAVAALSNPIARKTATWALVDACAESLTFAEVDAARRDLNGFPRPARRQIAAEKLIETSGKSPQEIVDWFAGQEPMSAEGAMALASAYRSLGRQGDAEGLIRRWWRTKSFEADVQRTMMTRFGAMLHVDDLIARADVLLYGPHGPATNAMVDALPPEQQPAARARMALRADASNAEALYDSLPASEQQSPGVAFERAAYLRRRGLDAQALALAPLFPREIVTSEQADRIWDERYRLTLSAIRSGNWEGAYQAAANSGLTDGADAAEAEFYAGWIALKRLNDPQAAGRHFAAIEKIGSSPITRGRAFYWMGRAAEARGDKVEAENDYAEGAQYNTTFYGQLAAEKAGLKLVLAHDPQPTAADRARFERREPVKAMRLLADQGQMDLFRVFAMHLDDTVPTTVEAALLVDAIRGYGEQDTSMRAARAAAMHGLVLTDRGYPMRSPPEVQGAPEPALVLAITRQESGFDPGVRSGANARGMMQLLPSTARIVARKIGVGYSDARLYEADYNMTLGSAYLGELVSRFSGSYIMASAGYNAGPGRPTQWSSFCGDPRGGATDPLDFIECIPFGETRNYVMRVLENMQVYRAKLNGGTATITLSNDLRRGAYNYAPVGQAVTASAP